MRFEVKDKRVTVAGAARSGLAAAELLARRGAHVTLSDGTRDSSRCNCCATLGVTLELGGHVRETFTDADLVVLSPGVPPEQPAIQAARDRGVPVIAEIELASRWLQGRLIAITGTKGKSTTTALTGRMLEAAGFKVTVGGNIGAPLSAQVSESTPDTFHVVETSSFQLEQIDTFHPWIAVMLNFQPITSIGIRTSRRMRRRRRGSSRTRTRATGRWSMPTIPRCWRSRAEAGRARACSREAVRSRTARWSRTDGSSIVSATAPNGSCRST